MDEISLGNQDSGKPWSNLAKVVFRRTYARRDRGYLENWYDTVERAVLANVEGRDVPAQEVNRLLQLAKQRKSGFAGRGWWFSGAPAHRHLGGAALCNCFSGDTRFVTRQGIRSFQQAVGEEVEVLDENQSWVKVRVDEHGMQPVRTVVLKRYGKEKAIRTTSQHTWYARETSKHNREQYTTETLPIGGYIASLTAHTVKEFSYEGIAHGVTFGDGTGSQGHGCSVMLINEKKKLSKYFARPVKDADTTCYVASRLSYLPDHYKDLPSLQENPNYLAGFLAGLIATDGSVHRSCGQVTIATSSYKVASRIVSLCARLGIDTCEIRKEVSQSNLTGSENICFIVPILSYSLPQEFLLRDEQKRLFRQRDKVVADDWKIISVSEEGEPEPVYCVHVPTTHTFTLEGNIFTGNCWALSADDWQNYVVAQDLLMLGGGVGLSVEHKYVSRLPHIKSGVSVRHKRSADADFIVPDSREGWCELLRRTLEAFLVTGKSFTYSTIVVRGHGEMIHGFGGTASGPLPLIRFIEMLEGIFRQREGKHLRTTDAADILTAIAGMVVAGNVRRSAIIILGDAWDKEYLKMKRWDLGSIPPHRANANYSIVAEAVEDIHPLFWKTYEQGEPFGIVNVSNIRKYGRMGELRKDTARLVNPCAEATLESHEPCNLVEQALCNMDSEEEFIESSRLWFRAAKRVTLEHYHHPKTEEVIQRNRRVGAGLTGILNSRLYDPRILDRAYQAIQAEDAQYSAELGVPLSIRTTLIKPSGTMGKVLDCQGYEGAHAAYSRYMIQRIRFASNDDLIPQLRAAGHPMEPVLRFDGSADHGTQVVDFYLKAPDGYPVADEDWDTWKQLDVLKTLQRFWADQAVSVTVYYRKEEIPRLKEWLTENLSSLKTISFLCHSDHGFKQAPKEAITQEQFERLSKRIKPLNLEEISEGDLESQECAGGFCPVK